MGPVKSRLRRSEANRQATQNPPLPQSFQDSSGKRNAARNKATREIRTGDINLNFGSSSGIDGRLHIHGRQTPNISPGFTADDYLTDEQFQFVKDNIDTVRVKSPSANLQFYKNKMIPKPLPGHIIEEILKMKGNHEKLTEQLKHIQWLFPTPSVSRANSSAQPLEPHEEKAIKGSKALKARFLEAYKMMLDYYGMKLISNRTGEVNRSDGWKNRYRHLNRNPKEFMRITRILTSIGCLGFAHLQLPWVTFMIKETYITQQLQIPVKSLQFWIVAISDESEKFACEQFLDTFTVPSDASRPFERRTENSRDIQEWNQDVINGSDSCFSVAAPCNPTAPPDHTCTVPMFTANDFLTDNEYDFIQAGGNEIDSNEYRYTTARQQTGQVQTEPSCRSAEQDDDRKVCKICLEEQVEVAFIPCGHAMACNACACMLKNCAVCRKDIEKVMRIYLS